MATCHDSAAEIAKLLRLYKQHYTLVGDAARLFRKPRPILLIPWAIADPHDSAKSPSPRYTSASQPPSSTSSTRGPRARTGPRRSGISARASTRSRTCGGPGARGRSGPLGRCSCSRASGTTARISRICRGGLARRTRIAVRSRRARSAIRWMGWLYSTRVVIWDSHMESPVRMWQRESTRVICWMAGKWWMALAAPQMTLPFSLTFLARNRRPML